MREPANRRMNGEGLRRGRPRLAIGIDVIREIFWRSGLFLSRRVCDNRIAMIRAEFAAIRIQQSKHYRDSSGQSQHLSVPPD